MNYATYDDLYKAATDKALELLEGCSPHHNIGPTIDLVLTAWRLGYDVVKQPATTSGDV